MISEKKLLELYSIYWIILYCTVACPLNDRQLGPFNRATCLQAVAQHNKAEGETRLEQQDYNA